MFPELMKLNVSRTNDIKPDLKALTPSRTDKRKPHQGATIQLLDDLTKRGSWKIMYIFKVL